MVIRMLQVSLLGRMSSQQFTFTLALAPDWLLADIALLAKIVSSTVMLVHHPYQCVWQSSLRMKMMCVQVIDELLGKKEVDFGKIDEHTTEANYRCVR